MKKIFFILSFALLAPIIGNAQSFLGDCNPATNLAVDFSGDCSKATLTWKAPAKSGRAVLLSENFEGMPQGQSNGPAGWTNIDADGDGKRWMGYYNFGTPVIQGHSGVGFMTSASWDSNPLYPNNYIITPNVTGATSVNYWVNAQDDLYPAEHYALCVSFTGTNSADFTIIFEETITAKSGAGESKGNFLGNEIDSCNKEGGCAKTQGVWYERTKNVPAGTKYIAWRHYNCSDMFRINLDDVTVYAGGEPGNFEYNVYRDNTTTPIAGNITETNYLDTGFDPTADHTWYVEVVCPEGGNSAKVDVTLEACEQPGDCLPATISELALGTVKGIYIEWGYAGAPGPVNIYRNGEKIKSNYEGADYFDTDPSLIIDVLYCYILIVNCPDGSTSDLSNEVCAKKPNAINENAKTTFSILPNPAHNNITVTAENNFHTIEVVNFLGQNVLSQPNVGNTATLDISSLGNGVYFARIISEKGTDVVKFVKQ